MGEIKKGSGPMLVFLLALAAIGVCNRKSSDITRPSQPIHSQSSRARFDDEGDRYDLGAYTDEYRSRGMTSRDVHDARFGRGRYAGKTGNPFIDRPFFNPWAPGGDFNKD